MADETIVIDGDARGGVAATVATSAAYRRMAADIAGATDQMRRQVERDRDAMARAAAKQAKAEREAAIDSVNAWKRADVVGMFRPWIDAREEYLEGAEKVGKAAMAQRVALLGLASGVTIAVTATVAAGAALVASAVDVIAHVDAQTLAMSTHRAELIEGHAAYVGLTTEVTRLRVELAGQLAPALTTTFDAMAGGLSVTTDLTRGLGDVADAIGLDVAATSRYIPVLGQLLTSMDVLALRGRRIREEAQVTAAAAGLGASVGAALAGKTGGRFDMMAEAEAQGRAQAEADAMMLVSQARGEAAKAATAHAAATRAEVEQLRSVEMAAWDASAAIDAMVDADAARAAASLADPSPKGNV